MCTHIRYIGIENAPAHIQDQIRRHFGDTISTGDIHSGEVEVWLCAGGWEDGRFKETHWRADVTSPSGMRPVEFYQ